MASIGFIIPTLNRPDALKNLLASFELQINKPDEIIIVEQGDGRSADLLARYNHLPIKYFKVSFKSLTAARNYGVAQSTTSLVGFLDDDIVLASDYVGKTLDFFDNNPEALGVQGVITDFEIGHAAKVGGNKFIYQLYNLFAKFFLLNNSSSTNRLLLSGRNQYASRPIGTQNCQWLSGIGIYRRAVFADFKFDEKLSGYALGEDKLFSYPIYQKFSKSLFVDPKICCEHHHASDGRPQDRAWVDMKVNYTYYLWNKLLRKRTGAIFAYWWANFGDLLVVFFSVILVKNSFKFWWWHLVNYWKILWRQPII